jgi:cytochrome P450
MTTLPSGPRGALRINWQLIRDPIGSALRWRSQYGDPMTLPEMGGKPFLLTGRPDGLRALFSAAPDSFESFGADMLGLIVGDSSVLVLSGAAHAAMRKLLMPPFHGQRMRVYGQQIRDLTRKLTREFKPGTRFVAQELMHAISLQTIIELVFGVSSSEQAARAERLVGDFRRAFTNPLLLLPILVPWLRCERGGIGPWARLRRAIAALHDLFRDEIGRRQQDLGERTDILSLLLAARHEDGTALGEQQIFDQLLTLLLAGHSTTGDALAWALYFLAREPQALGRLRAELAALGPDAEPDALSRAPFLEAVCNETLRLRPAVPTVARRLRAPGHFLGHDLPVGSGVGGSILWAHNNPEVFPEPERFLPERFLGRTYAPYEFVPFGGGQRRCIGAAFALYEMKLVLSTLLQRTGFELVDPKPVRVIQTTTLSPRSPIRLRCLPAPP